MCTNELLRYDKRAQRKEENYNKNYGFSLIFLGFGYILVIFSVIINSCVNVLVKVKEHVICKEVFKAKELVIC